MYLIGNEGEFLTKLATSSAYFLVVASSSRLSRLTKIATTGLSFDQSHRSSGQPGQT
jgi:hypothetical protein